MSGKNFAAAANCRESKARAALITAYREGLGLAPIAVIGAGTGIRILAVRSGCDAVVAPGEKIETQWWCRPAPDAGRVAAAATERLRRCRPKNDALESSAAHLSDPVPIISAALDLAGKAIAAAAKQCGATLYADQETLIAAVAVIARVEEEIERLQRAGELKSVNRSYKIYRTETTARGEIASPYAQWLNEYKVKLVRELAAALRLS